MRFGLKTKITTAGDPIVIQDESRDSRDESRYLRPEDPYRGHFRAGVHTRVPFEVSSRVHSKVYFVGGGAFVLQSSRLFPWVSSKTSSRVSS